MTDFLFFFFTGEWLKFSLKQNLQVPDVISDSSVLIVNNFLLVHVMKFKSISSSTSSSATDKKTPHTLQICCYINIQFSTD